MLDHVLGRPSAKSRRLQVLAVLTFWSFYLYKGDQHGPPLIRRLSKLGSNKFTLWRTVVLTMIYLYAARNFSTLVGLASPEPLANMYDPAYFRATWVMTGLDAGFWTAMKIRQKWLRDIASIVFSVFYMLAAEQADEKVRKVRGMLTVEHLRVGWNKSTTPFLRVFSNLLRPRFMRWPPRAIRIPRPSTSDYKDPIQAWLYYDGPVSDLEHINKMILDVPGGGFVAMTPRNHDDRLLAWAGKTNLPVLSLDYRKAPEFPYPYALNECFDVYSTIIQTKGRCIGMSGRQIPKIVVAGDSAGGNLGTAMTLMIIENSLTNKSPSPEKPVLPIPDGLVLAYPSLDMNIGNWMSDEQMSLIKDRTLRSTNERYLRRKSTQFNDLAGTPYQSDDEKEDEVGLTLDTKAVERTSGASDTDKSEIHSPQPAYSHANAQSWSQTHLPLATAEQSTSTSHQPTPLQTRLAVSSMISYFNDRVLTPEMMRAMIILYVGPHNRPDFSQEYFLSPILAPDILLQRFPKVYFMTGERDPLVDDTVIFAGRLRKVKRAHHMQRVSQRMSGVDTESDFDDKDVAEVVLIPGLSHGFLQVPSLFPPAWKLIDRCAKWATEMLNSAETRDQRERMRLAKRHHYRTESSGDEDKPLEISMTRIRGRTISDDAKKNGQATPTDTPPVESGVNLQKKKKKATNGKARFGEKKTKSIVKLNSSDDLLGRRMQGLAGPLTGTGEEEGSYFE